MPVFGLPIYRGAYYQANTGEDDMEEAPTDGRRYARQNAQWVVIHDAFTLDYAFVETTTEPPGAGQLRFNDIPMSANKIWMSKKTSPGVDVGNLLIDLGIGLSLYIQDKDTGSQWIMFDISGPVIDKSVYVEIPVNFKRTGEPLSAQRVLISSITAFPPSMEE